ncbi:hypothetical protein D1B31_16585 [Neobacillus notoginsengisoli]|uniref:Uncharacterized protein n=1 Tax=Neobacillus notoginsengisoli TaxID=1578198 RepID=A0A417YRJ9_9BACI|nr:ABC transporter permease [Neobacillus notoginsengisoli]RHW37376.1 hypothetical protein D1B31_16585 [Neobacillus notoginsengisoli]
MIRKAIQPIGTDSFPQLNRSGKRLTGRSLFFKRYRTELKYQAGVIRSVLDWTIWVYLVLPGLVIGGFMYAEALEEPITGIPFQLVVIGLLLTTLGGSIRTMLEEADLLFLLQEKGILREMKKHAFIHSVTRGLMVAALIFGLVMPLLARGYMLGPFEIAALFFAVFAIKLLLMTMNKRIINKYIRIAATFLVLVAGIPFLLLLPAWMYGIVGILMSLVLFAYNWAGTESDHTFFRDIEIEAAERRKWTGMILHFSPEIEHPPSRQKKRPIMFPYSERIFKKRTPENGLLEIVLKSFFRNWKEVGSVLQMASITSFAIFSTPLLLKWGIYLFFLAFLSIWLDSSFKRMATSPFFQVVPYEKDITYTVWPRFRRIIFLPLAALLGILAAAASFL